MPTAMITVERDLLLTDLNYRVNFDRDFLGFTKDDAKALNDAAPLVLPIIKNIVDGVYDHLFKYSYTKSVFLKRNVGFEGDIATSLDALTVDDPQMVFRKQFLRNWVSKILTADFDDPKFYQYLDKVGIMHTGAPGFKHRVNKASSPPDLDKRGRRADLSATQLQDPLKVDLQALSLTLGWVVDVVLSIVLSLPELVLSGSDKAALARAFNKIIWIQQDLFARHYTRTDSEAEAHLEKTLSSADAGASERELHALKQRELVEATAGLAKA